MEAKRDVKHTPSGNLSAQPDLASLIARYGSASSTAWTEPQYNIWREHPDAEPVLLQRDGEEQERVPGRGAVVGYLRAKDYAIAWGNPLCPPNDYERVANLWLEYVKKEAWKPLWCCIDEDMEHVLADKHNWAALSCAKEDVVDPVLEGSLEGHDKRLKTKINKAERAGVTIVEEDGHVPEAAMKQQVEEGMKAWQKNRHGVQIHVTDLTPWRDSEHRRYFYAKDAEGKVCGMVVLAQAAHNSWVVKWSLEFPGAPKGVSETLVMRALQKLKEEGSHHLTFGISGANKLEPVSHLNGWKVEWLAKTYNGLARSFGLGRKSDFRSKFGAHDDKVYICFPEGGLGLGGINALMSVLKEGE